MNFLNDQRQPLQKGLILSAREYKDKDAICAFLTPEGLEQVYARGTQKSGSLNARLTRPFTLAELSFGLQYSGTYLYLYNGRVLKSFDQIYDDLDKMALCEVLSWIVQPAPIPQQYYELLLETWNLLNENNPMQWTAACLLLALRFHEEGIAPHVDSCVVCQSREQIRGFSLSQGGFVCRDHANPEDVSSPARLKKIRLLFHAQWKNLSALYEKAAFSLDDFCTLCRWYMQLMEVQPACMRFLLMIHKPENTDIKKDQL